MNTQQLIAAIKAATKTIEVHTPGENYWGGKKVDTISYIDADAFLEAVEGLAEAENAKDIPEQPYEETSKVHGGWLDYKP